MITMKNMKNTSPFALLVVLLVGGLMLIAAPAVHAQEDDGVEVGLAPAAEEAAPAAAPAAPTEGSRSLIDMIRAGGWAMWPLGALSIAGLGLVVYNFISVTPAKVLRMEDIREVTEKAKAMDLEGARAVCAERPSTLTNIVDAGLERIDLEVLDPEALEKAMEEASVEEISGPFVYINYLSVVANLAPMLGLLGTVSGMVKAFNTIAAQGVGQPQLLAANISEALITTATGMIIGIPAMFFYFFFKNKYGKITAAVSRIVGDFHHEFVMAARKGHIGGQ